MAFNIDTDIRPLSQPDQQSLSGMRGIETERTAIETGGQNGFAMLAIFEFEDGGIVDPEGCCERPAQRSARDGKATSVVRKAEAIRTFSLVARQEPQTVLKGELVGTKAVKAQLQGS